MINLFIDTNIFLSFFHWTSEDLEELKKLIVLMDNDEIRLFLPEQVRNEFARNRGAKIVDAMRKLQDATRDTRALMVRSIRLKDFAGQQISSAITFARTSSKKLTPSRTRSSVSSVGSRPPVNFDAF